LLCAAEVSVKHETSGGGCNGSGCENLADFTSLTEQRRIIAAKFVQSRTPSAALRDDRVSETRGIWDPFASLAIGFRRTVDSLPTGLTDHLNAFDSNK
jgi:hypothetical protein